MSRFNMIHMCENCSNIIEDDYEETTMYVLNFPQMDVFLFCSEECRQEFIEEYFSEVYVQPNGKIIRD